jgi:hypothetical protein
MGGAKLDTEAAALATFNDNRHKTLGHISARPAIAAHSIQHVACQTSLSKRGVQQAWLRCPDGSTPLSKYRRWRAKTIPGNTIRQYDEDGIEFSASSEAFRCFYPEGSLVGGNPS